MTRYNNILLFALLNLLPIPSFSQSIEECYDKSGIDSVWVFPEFPGGTDSLYSFFITNFKIPNTDKYINGTIYIKFSIDTLGKVENPRVLRGIKNADEYNAEALRVISILPAWRPGINIEGKRERVEITLPIKIGHR